MDGAATQAFLALAGMNERVELSVAPNDPELEELKAETGQSVKVAKRLIEDQYRENPFKLFEFQLEYFVRQRMNEARKLLNDLRSVCTYVKDLEAELAQAESELEGDF